MLGSLITIPDQPWAWGETRHPLQSSQCSEVSCGRVRAGPEFEPRAPLTKVTGMDEVGGQLVLCCAPPSSQYPTLFQESCYGEFIKDFISTLKNLMKDNKNEHLQKVYENMKHLTQICTKLQVSCCLLLGEPDTLFSLLQPEAQQGKGLLMAPACYIGGLGNYFPIQKPTG